jgi:hypothetical protein
MSGLTDTNIVLGQGNAIKEVHNIRRHDLELNQQFVAQKTEDKKKEEKLKVRDFETENRIEIKDDEEKPREEGPRYNERGSKKNKSNQAIDSQETKLIDIKV